jgi:hypothetical protein
LFAINWFTSTLCYQPFCLSYSLSRLFSTPLSCSSSCPLFSSLLALLLLCPLSFFAFVFALCLPLPLSCFLSCPLSSFTMLPIIAFLASLFAIALAVYYPSSFTAMFATFSTLFKIYFQPLLWLYFYFSLFRFALSNFVLLQLVLLYFALFNFASLCFNSPYFAAFCFIFVFFIVFVRF